MPKHPGKFAIAMLLVSMVLPLVAQAVARDVIGRAFEVAGGRGIENLEVKLTPPRSSDLPVRLTNTDQNGGFRFAQVKQGKYLLEISQGPNLLYRNEIDSGAEANINIPLQKR